MCQSLFSVQLRWMGTGAYKFQEGSKGIVNVLQKTSEAIYCVWEMKQNLEININYAQIQVTFSPFCEQIIQTAFMNRMNN